MFPLTLDEYRQRQYDAYEHLLEYRRKLRDDAIQYVTDEMMFPDATMRHVKELRDYVDSIQETITDMEINLPCIALVRLVGWSVHDELRYSRHVWVDIGTKVQLLDRDYFKWHVDFHLELFPPMNLSLFSNVPVDIAIKPIKIYPIYADIGRWTLAYFQEVNTVFVAYV